MAWGARVALRRPPRNRLKLGARREGAVSDVLLENLASNSHGRRWYLDDHGKHVFITEEHLFKTYVLGTGENWDGAEIVPTDI